MPNIETNLNPKKTKYIDRESYEWTQEQSSKRNKEWFFNATIVLAAAAVYATWACMIVQKIKA